MKILLNWVAVIIILSGCSPKEKQLSGSFKEIAVSTNEIAEQINLSDIASATKVIQLQTNENCLIGSVDKIDFYGDTILILDKKVQQVLLFDKGGNFISKIHKIGKGPGEYQNIMDFFVDDNSRLNLLTGTDILTYSIDGAFLGKKDLPFYAVRAINCSDSLIVFKQSWSNYIEGATDPIEHKIVISDINYNKFVYGLPFDLRNHDIGLIDYPIVFSKLKESIFYFKFFNDTVFEISGNKVGPHSYIDFGSEKTPKEYYGLKRRVLNKSEWVAQAEIYLCKV